MSGKYSTKGVEQEGRVKAPNISSTPRDFHNTPGTKRQDNSGITCDIKFTVKKPRG